MSNQFDMKLIAPCGMNCGICIAFFGYTMSGKRRKHACSSCWSRERLCAFIKKECEKVASKQLHYCFECNDFPCEQLQQLDSRYRQRFGMSMIDNLKNIKENGMEKFLQEQEEKYKCPKCGGVICVHNGKCYSCGTNME